MNIYDYTSGSNDAILSLHVSPAPTKPFITNINVRDKTDSVRRIFLTLCLILSHAVLLLQTAVGVDAARCESVLHILHQIIPKDKYTQRETVSICSLMMVIIWKYN